MTNSSGPIRVPYGTPSLSFTHLLLCPLYLGNGKKKRNFSWQKPWGHFLKTVASRDFFTEHKIRENWGNFTKSVIYHDQKSKKLPNDRHNERAAVRILIQNGTEISDNSALAWHCATCTFLDGCFKLYSPQFMNRVFNMKHVFFKVIISSENNLIWYFFVFLISFRQ